VNRRPRQRQGEGCGHQSGFVWLAHANQRPEVPPTDSVKSACVHALPIDPSGHSSGGAGCPPRERRRARLLEAAAILGVVLILSGCPATVDRPERVVTPDAVGIIEDIEASEDGTAKTLLLDSGETVVVDDTRDLEAYGTNANVGFLLITGEPGEARWTMFLQQDGGLEPPDCYQVGIQPFDDGSHVILPAASPDGGYGIRLPKAPDFEADDPNRETQRYGSTGSPTFFCLNEQGEVTGQADLLRRESE